MFGPAFIPPKIQINMQLHLEIDDVDDDGGGGGGGGNNSNSNDGGAFFAFSTRTFSFPISHFHLISANIFNLSDVSVCF